MILLRSHPPRRQQAAEANCLQPTGSGAGEIKWFKKFNNANQYHDKNSSNTLSLHSDKCYEDKSGTQFCMDNTRIQNIPPRLITDPTNCTVLNEIGVYKDRKMRSDINDRVINGGAFFSGIYASQKKNEVWSSPVELKPGDCDV